jgi:hypothetical protein
MTHVVLGRDSRDLGANGSNGSRCKSLHSDPEPSVGLGTEQRPVPWHNRRSRIRLADKLSAFADIRVSTLARRLRVAFLPFAHR